MPEENDDNENDSPAIKELRNQIKTLQGQVTTMTTENTTLKATNLLSNAGLGHLNEHQRAAVMGLHGDSELTEESMLTAAGHLGFEPKTNTPPAPTPPTPNGNGTTDATNNGDANDPNADPREAMIRRALAEMDANPTANNPIAVMSTLQRINSAGQAARKDSSGKTFEERIRATKTREELETLISTEGPFHGVAMENDFD